MKSVKCFICKCDLDVENEEDLERTDLLCQECYEKNSELYIDVEDIK